MIADATPIDWAQTGVIGGLVLLIVITGYRRLWVFYWVHRDIVDGLKAQLEASRIEKNEWKRMALQQVGIIENTVDRTAKLVYRADSVQRRERLDELIDLLTRKEGDE